MAEEKHGKNNLVGIIKTSSAATLTGITATVNITLAGLTLALPIKHFIYEANDPVLTMQVGLGTILCMLGAMMCSYYTKECATLTKNCYNELLSNYK